MLRGSPGALVTGAAGGIGKAVSSRLARDGFRVFLNDVGKQQEIGLLASNIADSGGCAVAVEGDITQEAGIDAIIASLQSPMQAFIHCAVAPLEERWFLKTPVENFNRQWELAVRAPVCILQRILPAMLEVRRGAVVWVLTTATVGAPPKQMSAYASGKMAALGLMRCLAAEYASKGIRFNAVSPAFTETPLTAATPAAVRELYRKAIPMGRLASPEDTASAVSYLVSEDSSFVTGLNLPVCGGAVML